MTRKPKIIACFSGLDPTGGAGIQADIETCHAYHNHCLPLITVNTVQNSAAILDTDETDVHFLEKQFKTLQEEFHIDAIKIGLLGSIEQVLWLASILETLGLPTIIDPVLSSGFGSAAKSKEFVSVFAKTLLPHATVLTPNSIEARKLFHALNQKNETPHADQRSRHDIAEPILAKGCEHLLITGGHDMQEQQNTLEHRLYSASTEPLLFENERLSGEFHGSGCTLSTAICNELLAHDSITTAVEKGLDFTFNSLRNSHNIAKHQMFPKR